MNKATVLTLAATSLLVGCTMPAAAPRSGQAGIPFVEFGAIKDWRADGSQGLYVQSIDRRWYHATFLSQCIDLPYAETIGFRSTPPLPLDRFDSVLVRGQPCYFKTFEKSPGPPGNNPPSPPQKF